jgi:hypothetical protein
MYNLVIAIAISLVSFLLAPLLGFPLISGFLPAMVAFPIALFWLVRRTQSQVEAALAPMPGLAMKAQQATTPAERDAALDAVRTLLLEVRARYGRWQYLLEDTVDGQLGQLAYARQQYDEAAPLLAKGTRDWNAQVALACIHFRKGEVDAMKAAFVAAAAAAEKEPTVYLMWGVLLDKKGEREPALVAASTGFEKAPENKSLKHLRHQLANKGTFDAESLGEIWYQFFPEDLMKHMVMRGRRGEEGLPAALRGRMPPPDPRAGRMRR